MEDDPKYSDSFQRAASADNPPSLQPKKNPNKRRRGRPAKKIDPVELEKVAWMQFTDDEIAAYFGVDRRTITRKRKQPEFREAAIYLDKRFGYRDVSAAEAETQEPETEAQRESRRKEALRKIRELYGLDPDPSK